MAEVTLLERMKDAGKTIGLKEAEYQEIVAALEAVRNLRLLCNEGRCPEFYHKHDDNLANMGIPCVQLMVMDGGERVHNDLSHTRGSVSEMGQEDLETWPSTQSER